MHTPLIYPIETPLLMEIAGFIIRSFCWEGNRDVESKYLFAFIYHTRLY